MRGGVRWWQKQVRKTTNVISEVTPTGRPGPRDISTEVSEKVTTGQSETQETNL